ncbi:dienelactone hydrolase [Suillus fuscotomentosus]|uniref:Dienelactone hydrolase n=1 Tax=Suillus fuscotomentosus TaxID=1912939 RepID=A0AAD4HJ89_9AGAM|nr:dienelactone hydrolase [Suillus fuscotomentosus]KAG1898557.1 dienelactone hydrolase [Suillus fuscotomentosus]
MSFCKDCIQGVRHEGEPQGTLEIIDGVSCYVATPTVDYPKDKVILFLPDVFGIESNNAKLLADDFVINGFKVVAVDYFNGDGLPIDVMNSASFDVKAWFAKHGTEQTRPPLDKVIAVLKERGVTKFGATGYCFGGRYTFDLAFDNVIQCSVVSHPSLLKVPDDLEAYFTKSKAPLLINSCEVDEKFPAEAQTQADEIFGDGKFAPGYKREYFPGCTHGFAVRGDIKDPLIKAGKEGSFKAAVEFFREHL